jgi:hypothetical protein
MHGTLFSSPPAVVGVKRWRVLGIRPRPTTSKASVEPAKRACRPTQMPKKGLPAAMCLWIAGRKPEAARLERQWPKWPTPGKMSFWTGEQGQRRRMG